MEMIGVDLRKRESQLCVRTDEGRFMETRVGGAVPGGAGARGDRGGSGVCADVRDAVEAGEDGQAGRAGAVRGVCGGGRVAAIHRASGLGSR